jgi:predicted RNA-binding Zn ribbon-like protein
VTEIELDPRAADEQLLLAFANSHGYGRRPERLGDGPGLLEWLEEFGWLGISPGEGQITDADAAEARELRDALVVVLLGNAHDPHTDPERVHAAEALLRRAGERYPLTSRIDAGGFRLHAAGTGMPGVFGQVVASMTTLSLNGRWPRFKACRNEPCHRAFVDNSRNSSAGYCRTQCGSAASMRAHRARRAADAGHTTPGR